MSSFLCSHCKEAIIDTPIGYITECEHYPLSIKGKAIAISYCNTRIKEFKRFKELLSDNNI